MGKQELLDRLKDLVVNGDEEGIKEATKRALEAGIDPLEIINEGLKKGLDTVGEKYEKLELFLPDLVLAADTAYAALNIIIPKLSERAQEFRKGKVVIGTIYGDIHDIGKNIVASLLRANGYEVFDLGSDVEPRKFVEEAERAEADFIAISCLLSPSMFYMRDVIQRLVDMGIRDKYYVIVGGAAVYPEWAKEIGADGWAKDAEGAVKLCNLLKERGKEVEKPVLVGEWR